jgi:hypothetical protein
MCEVVVPIRIQGATKWRSYGTAGLGLIRAWVNFGDCCSQSASEEARHQNNLGFNAGGGVMYSLSERVGLRGDLRYFRVLVDENQSRAVVFKDYGFWRGAVGVTIGFRRQSPRIRLPVARSSVTAAALRSAGQPAVRTRAS